MEIETKVISIEIIKPSSPTPKSLQKHQLSLLDQCTQPILLPIVYFFSSNLKTSNHLKKSLSETLSTYYPLAGRRPGNLYVDCNDGGVPFSETEANCNLSQIIHNPNPKFMTKLLPHEIIESPDLCMAVQATYFRCGGLALGLLFSHKIVDGLSLTLFVKSWSSIARTGDFGGVPLPKFDGAAYFPPRDIPEPGFTMREDVTTKTLTFPAAKIYLLRERYSGGGRRRPSRVEALSVYLWTQFLSATIRQPDTNKIYQFSNPVNLRSYIDDLPPSHYHFGNVFGMSITKTSVGDDDIEILKKNRQANEGVYGNYTALVRMNDAVENSIAAETQLTFSSHCGFPYYEVDFGWGKPVWVGSPGLPINNLIGFFDAKTEGDIDAMIHLSEQDMEIFEAHLKRQPILKSSL